MVKETKIIPQNPFGITIEQLDRKYLDEIGRRFEEGHTNTAIVAYLANCGIQINRAKIVKYRMTKYPHTLSQKARKAMARGKNYPKELLPTVYEKETESIVAEIQNLPDSLALEDKALYLDALITKVNTRIRHFDTLFVHTNRSGFNPRIDSCYQKYIEIAKDLIESKARLAGELDTTKTTVVNVINAEIPLLIGKFKTLIEQIAPDKLGEFRRRLSELYSDKMEAISEKNEKQ